MTPDVTIIGSGAGGGTMAYALSKAGLNVLVLEAGPRFDPFSDYHLEDDDWERPFPAQNFPSTYEVAELQSLPSELDDLRSWNHLSGRLNPTSRRVSFGYHHVRGVGGSSLHFTGEAHRMNPHAMRLKSDFGIGADWPLFYADLEPYYRSAEAFVGVASDPSDPDRWGQRDHCQPAHPLSFASQHLAKAMQATGLTPHSNPLFVLSQAKDDRPACNYCGGCLRGCSRRDKGSVDLTYLAAATHTGRCEVQADAQVIEIMAGPDKTVRAIVVAKGDQIETIPVVRLIVAGGAVQTPRLLLSSVSPEAPNGIANESGQVGRNFMETILWTSSGLHTQPLGSHRGLPVDLIAWDFNRPDAIDGVVGGCRFSVAQAESDLVGPKAYATRVVGGWGREHKRAMRESFGKVLSVAGIAESLPHKESRVDLSQKVDTFGRPLAQIVSYLDGQAMDRIRFMAKTCRNILTHAGVTAIFEEFSSCDVFSSSHVFGTCRMGYNPHTSVVDDACRSHFWQNLWIVDASVFPSSGGGEAPALTIQALALRAAEKLVARI